MFFQILLYVILLSITTNSDNICYSFSDKIFVVHQFFNLSVVPPSSFKLRPLLQRNEPEEKSLHCWIWKLVYLAYLIISYPMLKLMNSFKADYNRKKLSTEFANLIVSTIQWSRKKYKFMGRWPLQKGHSLLLAVC